jgi:hypothetical protein
MLDLKSKTFSSPYNMKLSWLYFCSSLSVEAD